MDKKCTAKILYHGTTQNALKECVSKHDHYRNVIEDNVYMSENPLFPATLALAKAKRYNSKPMLLIIDRSKIPSDVMPDFENNEWWHTDELPKDSYITYDLEKDSMEILKKGNRKGANSKLESLLKQKKIRVSPQ